VERREREGEVVVGHGGGEQWGFGSEEGGRWKVVAE